MRKKLYYLLALIMCCFLFALGYDAKAASKTTKKQAVYTIKKHKKSYKGKKVTIKYRYDVPELKGKSKVVKQINKSLKNDYLKEKGHTIVDEYKNGKNGIDSYSRQEEWFELKKCKCTYNQNGYLSFKYSGDWFAGGVYNGWNYGMNYNLKNGKKLKLKDVMAGSSYKIKRTIADTAVAEGYSFMESHIMEMKLSEFAFYLKDGNVVICFGPYVPGGGNGHLDLTVKGNY